MLVATWTTSENWYFKAMPDTIVKFLDERIEEYSCICEFLYLLRSNVTKIVN